MEDIEKENLIKKSSDLKNKHESIKSEMLKILDASRILEEEYKVLESELYVVEDEYINTMKQLL